MGYEKLSSEFKQKVLVPVWKEYSADIKKQYGFDLAQDGLELRHRAQTDGFWLAKVALGHERFSECHKELFSSPDKEGFFLLKDPGAMSFQEFAQADKELHERLLTLPRTGLKSYADIVDCVQYVICFPNIRINILTATLDLATEFVGVIRGHFTLNEDGGVRIGPDGKLKLIQVLFPEHCQKKPPSKPEWITPARKDLSIAGPTIRAISLDKNTTGTHCDVIKLDDGTSAENTRTAEGLKKVNYQIGMCRKLCETYGYKDNIGTPYADTDYLCRMLKDEAIRRDKGQPPAVKIVMHPAYVAKPGFEDLNPDELTDDKINLWFPEFIPLKFLKDEYVAAVRQGTAEIFFSQYLLDIHRAATVKFRRDIMIARTTENLPQSGVIFQAWDLAYSEKESAKFTVGMAGIFSSDGIFLIDMARDRYNEYELPRMMATFAAKWKPRCVAVEDSMGARWLRPELRREQERLRSNVPFEFVSLGKGTKTRSKEIKAKSVVRLLGDGRLFFWKGMPGLEEVYGELEAFPKGTFSDIVCSLSLLINHFGKTVDALVCAQPITINERKELTYKR